MPRYSAKFIKKAKKIRFDEKISIAELGRRLNVPNATLGKWCNEAVGNRWDNVIKNNETKRKILRKSEILVVPNVNKLSNNQTKLFVSLLYGCEGSKYPAQRGVAFANSDPNLVASFVKLLKMSFGLEDNKFSIHLQIHSNQNFEKLRKYWSGKLSIPEEQFIKPTITIAKDTKHRSNYMGTCTVRYRDYRIQLKMLGIFENFTSRLAR